jgi:hypothetical protein
MKILSRLFSKKIKKTNTVDWSKIDKIYYYNNAVILAKEGNYQEAEKGYRLLYEKLS